MASQPSGDHGHHGDQPSPWLARFAPLLRPGGTVLDLACGRGRHARYLAARGHAVEAVDRDAQALSALAGVSGVTATCADLEAGPWPYAGRRFDGIVVTNYLHRPLFGELLQSLAEGGGVLVYETFMRGNERFAKPSNPAFLLEPGELLAAFRALTVVAFEQGRVDSPWPAVVQRLCAVKGALASAISLPR
jgi:SAM-dependent methyltransferase